LKERDFAARMAEVGHEAVPAHHRDDRRRYQRLWKASDGGSGGGGAARRGAACDGRVARGAAGDESASPLARIIGIKRPICRPMIASRSAT